MTPEIPRLVLLASTLSLGMLCLAMFLVLARLLRGPSLADRVVALDLLALLAVGMIVAYDILTQQPILLRSAIILALLSFLGTVAFGYYIGKERQS
ncbi:MAG: cation:proton antiporter [Deltaproteobacteria bacterium]|nr:cation:proton antiporter [Deltaproteobacteria bacterium]